MRKSSFCDIFDKNDFFCVQKVASEKLKDQRKLYKLIKKKFGDLVNVSISGKLGQLCDFLLLLKLPRVYLSTDISFIAIGYTLNMVGSQIKFDRIQHFCC